MSPRSDGIPTLTYPSNVVPLRPRPEPGVSLAEVQAAFDRLNTPPNLHQAFAELRPEVRR